MCELRQWDRQRKGEAHRAICKCGRAIYRVRNTAFWYHVDNDNHMCDAPTSHLLHAKPSYQVKSQTVCMPCESIANQRLEVSSRG